MFIWNSVYFRKAKVIKQSINYLKCLALILGGLGYMLNFITVLKAESSTARGSVSEAAGKENAWIGFFSEKRRVVLLVDEGCSEQTVGTNPDPVAQGMVPATPVAPRVQPPPSAAISQRGRSRTAGSRRRVTSAEGGGTVPSLFPPNLIATGQTRGRLSLSAGAHSACIAQGPQVLFSRDAEIQM